VEERQGATEMTHTHTHTWARERVLPGDREEEGETRTHELTNSRHLSTNVVRLILVQLRLILVQSRVRRPQKCSWDRRGLRKQQR